MNSARLPTGQLLAYGSLGLPLAMAALPVYVQAPHFYTQEMGLSLGLAGGVLFAARLVDTVQDPWLGSLVDRWQSQRGAWLRTILLGSVLLALSLALLLVPPRLGQIGLALWLGLMLILTYSAHSLVNITCNAWGARLSDDENERTRVTSVREGMGLAGVLIASVLPSIAAQWLGMRMALALYAVVFALLLAGACVALWRRGARPQFAQTRQATHQHWRTVLGNRAFRRLALAYLFNGLAVAIPATLALFFISDRLQLAQWSGLFLACYFLCGALGLPLWNRLAARIGKRRAWRCGMLLGILGFIWASQLAAGDFWPYLLICALTGAVLGADLALPPALLADVIPAEQRDLTASYFGIWSLLGKLPLAASGLALPLLAFSGYQTGQAAGWQLAAVYAGLPCLLKIGALCVLSPRALSGESS